MLTNLHSDICVSVWAQQYLGFIAEALQCTHNHIELNNTLCILLNYLLEEWSELHEMQYAHLPPTCCQMLTKCHGQWLECKCALQEELHEHVVIHLWIESKTIDALIGM